MHTDCVWRWPLKYQPRPAWIQAAAVANRSGIRGPWRWGCLVGLIRCVCVRMVNLVRRWCRVARWCEPAASSWVTLVIRGAIGTAGAGGGGGGLRLRLSSHKVSLSLAGTMAMTKNRLSRPRFGTGLVSRQASADAGRRSERSLVGWSALLGQLRSQIAQRWIGQHPARW